MATGRGAIPEAPVDAGQAAWITVPTLLLTGSHSPGPAPADIATVAAVLPDAWIVVVDGQQHVADILSREVFAGAGRGPRRPRRR